MNRHMKKETIVMKKRKYESFQFSEPIARMNMLQKAVKLLKIFEKESQLLDEPEFNQTTPIDELINKQYKMFIEKNGPMGMEGCTLGQFEKAYKSYRMALEKKVTGHFMKVVRSIKVNYPLEGVLFVNYVIEKIKNQSSLSDESQRILNGLNSYTSEILNLVQQDEEVKEAVDMRNWKLRCKNWKQVVVTSSADPPSA